jgi:hypothetical protein
MQNENAPAEGNDSAQLEAESALRGAACSPSSLRDRFSWSRVKPTERTIPETLEDVVLLLESRMEVHQDWLDWFRAGDPTETARASAEGVGTAESQEYYIAQYRAAIKIIRWAIQENSIRITDTLCVLDDLEHSKTVCGGFPKMCLRKIREILTENASVDLPPNGQPESKKDTPGG